MNYTESELLALINRHDEHEDYYLSKLMELRADTLYDAVGVTLFRAEFRQLYAAHIHNSLERKQHDQD